MYLKVSSLPKFSEILSFRSRFMKGSKMTKEERNHAQNVLNEEIEQWLEEQKEDTKSREMELTEITSNVFKQVQDKNAKGGL